MCLRRSPPRRCPPHRAPPFATSVSSAVSCHEFQRVLVGSPDCVAFATVRMGDVGRSAPRPSGARPLWSQALCLSSGDAASPVSPSERLVRTASPVRTCRDRRSPRLIRALVVVCVVSVRFVDDPVLPALLEDRLATLTVPSFVVQRPNCLSNRDTWAESALTTVSRRPKSPLGENPSRDFVKHRCRCRPAPRLQCSRLPVRRELRPATAVLNARTRSSGPRMPARCALAAATNSAALRGENSGTIRVGIACQGGEERVSSGGHSTPDRRRHGTRQRHGPRLA
jgi:hypothetical protein